MLFLFKITIFLLYFLFFNFSYAASVDVGPDIDLTTPVSDDLHLSANVNGFELCDIIDYFWTESSRTLFIETPYEKDMAMIYSNDLNDNPGTYTIKLTATCNGGDPANGGFEEEDEFILTITDSSSEASVDAGEDQEVELGNTVSLNGTLNGFPSSGCSFSYNWSELSNSVNINNSGSLTGVNFETTSLSGSTTLEVKLTVNVSSESMTHDSCGKTGVYEDSLNIYVVNDGSPSGSGTTTHHSSYHSKMINEANKIFLNPKKIKLVLTEDDIKNKYFYKLKWNYIGGAEQIEYILDYSTTKDFKKFNSINTKSRFYNFYKGDLENSLLYYFRVKARYKNKDSPYSNIVTITNKDDPLSQFKITCPSCEINKYLFSDVFETVDLLIEKGFIVKCESCDRKKLKYLFNDILNYSDKFDFVIDKEKFCRSKINFNDIFDEDIGIDFNISKQDFCNKKIDFKDILEEKEFQTKCNFPNKKINFNDIFK